MHDVGIGGLCCIGTRRIVGWLVRRGACYIAYLRTSIDLIVRHAARSIAGIARHGSWIIEAIACDVIGCIVPITAVIGRSFWGLSASNICSDRLNTGGIWASHLGDTGGRFRPLAPVHAQQNFLVIRWGIATPLKRTVLSAPISS